MVLVATRRSVLERSIDMKKVLSSNILSSANAGTQGHQSGAVRSRYPSLPVRDDDKDRQEELRLLNPNSGPTLDAPTIGPTPSISWRDRVTMGGTYGRCNDENVSLERPRRALLSSATSTSS